MMELGEYLRARRPAWDWQTHDCSRWLDRWLVLRGHASAMEATGIAYDSERSAARVIVRGGGLLSLWQRGMEAIGLAVVDEPQMGDAAILSAPTDDGHNRTTGIWTGQRWASVHRHGLICAPGDPLMIWRV
ncbi:hypothetical protein N6H05_14655 [Sphingobium sp. WTD-1]|uniref:DUF6950 family protein n=1 Tax=Sphingobium sp. WTD-1 TaxID=2979467 RepID=UPI0024DED3D9|nr:hypothetical protein [Sphingobium sp. WTD-1]WIA54304.1 hypothetical protein N6H05_14655 [Sphingobium sp. WTD-1]